MSNVIEGVSRRKLYDYMMVFESFLLELEQFTLYKSNSNLKIETQNPNFEKGLLDIFSKCIVIIHFFFENKIIPLSQEFLTLVEKEQKNISNHIQALEEFELFNSTDVKNYELLLIKLKTENWSNSNEEIKSIFDLCEEFHTKLIKVLEFRRE